MNKEFRFYDVIWNANKINHMYSGIEKVWATNENEARVKARIQISNRMVLARRLIDITDVGITKQS